MARREAYYVASAIILGIALITIVPRLLVSTTPLMYEIPFSEERLIKTYMATTSALLPELTFTILNVFSPALAAALVAYEVEKLKRKIRVKRHKRSVM